MATLNNHYHIEHLNTNQQKEQLINLRKISLELNICFNTLLKDNGFSLGLNK